MELQYFDRSHDTPNDIKMNSLLCCYIPYAVYWWSSLEVFGVGKKWEGRCINKRENSSLALTVDHAEFFSSQLAFIDFVIIICGLHLWFKEPKSDKIFKRHGTAWITPLRLGSVSHIHLIRNLGIKTVQISESETFASRTYLEFYLSLQTGN